MSNNCAEWTITSATQQLEAWGQVLCGSFARGAAV